MREATKQRAPDGCTDDSAAVPLGYKRTEVGVIPEDWQARPLGTIGSFSKGQGVRKNEASSGELPCIRYGEIYTHHNEVVRAYFSHISQEVAASSKKLAQGDILFAGSGETKEDIGKAVAFVGDEGAYAGGDIVILSPYTGCPEFLGYLLNAPVVARQKAAKGQGDAVVHISASALGAVVAPLPPPHEQRTIAEALLDVDGLLGALEALIAKKRAIKQGAMQQLLTGKTRLPGFSGPWETKRLGGVGHFLKGSGVRRDDAQSGSLACVRYGEIYTTHDDYIRAFHSWISQEVAATATPLEFGDLLFAGSGETKEEIGKCIAFVTDAEAYAGGDIVILRPKGVDPLFLGYALNVPEVARQKASLGQGDAVVHISAAALGQVCLALPSVEEQAAIATVLSDMDAEIAALESRRDKTRAIKQGMMQQLLTGRVRLLKPVTKEAPC